MIVKEWRCKGHGTFEGTEPRCPHGCTAVERVFLTPPGFVGEKTRFSDRMFSQIAKDYGFTDMKSGSLSRGNGAARPTPNMQARFAPMGKTVDSTLAEHHAPASNVVAAVKGAGVVGGVKSVNDFKHATIVKRDPDSGSRAKVLAG